MQISTVSVDKIAAKYSESCFSCEAMAPVFESLINDKGIHLDSERCWFEEPFSVDPRE